MIDSHCHLDCDAFSLDRDAALARAGACGVTDIVVPAVGEDTWAPIAHLASHTGSPRCHAALGVHPVALPNTSADDDNGLLRRLAVRLDKGDVIAVGECGLDATLDLTLAPWVRQEHMLCEQLLLAKRLNLPLILHGRGAEAYQRLLRCLQRLGLPQAGGVIHSYGGGAHLVEPFVALGLHFGFAGPATYANARKVRQSIAAVPKDRLLAETDAPDQTPEPYRPGRSEPAYVAQIVSGLASACDVPLNEMRALTVANARRLFRL